MSWFKRNDSPAAGAQPAALPVRHHSLAFETALRELEREAASGSRPLLLDLGPALGPNVEFFSERACRLQIVDLYRSLPDQALAAEPEQLALDLASALPTPTVGATLVLAWDLFNYFRLEALAALGLRLAECTAPGGIVLALVATHKDMPARPQRYRILDPKTLETTVDGASTAAAPRYRQPELERALPAFRVETTYLLRAGMQEYLLRRRK
ncbi:MAG: hypothetical protein ABI609_09210 [Acidobacteriota bacterium]